MENTEIYSLKHNGQSLVFDKNQDSELQDLISLWDGEGPLLILGDKKFEQQYVLGHEENLLCKVYKHSSGSGGIIAILEHSKLLLVAYAMDNLAYIEGIAHYSKVVAYTRYGYDIFMDEQD